MSDLKEDKSVEGRGMMDAAEMEDKIADLADLMGTWWHEAARLRMRVEAAECERNEALKELDEVHIREQAAKKERDEWHAAYDAAEQQRVVEQDRRREIELQRDAAMGRHTLREMERDQARKERDKALEDFARVHSQLAAADLDTKRWRTERDMAMSELALINNALAGVEVGRHPSGREFTRDECITKLCKEHEKLEAEVQYWTAKTTDALELVPKKQAQITELQAEIERLTKERDQAKGDTIERLEKLLNRFHASSEDAWQSEQDEFAQEMEEHICARESARAAILDMVRELARRAEAAEKERDALKADLARVSDELGLPPGIGPAPGEIRRLREAALAYWAAGDAYARAEAAVKERREIAAEAGRLKAEVERLKKRAHNQRAQLRRLNQLGWHRLEYSHEMRQKWAEKTAEANQQAAKLQAQVTELQARMTEMVESQLHRRVAAFYAEVVGRPFAGGPPRVPPVEELRAKLRLVAEEFFEVLDACSTTEPSCSIASRPSGLRDRAQRDHIRIARERLTAYIDAVDTADLVRIADGIADSCYVNQGLALACGIHMPPVIDEVHRSNMAKCGGQLDAAGKFRKPAGWTPPDLERVLREQGWAGHEKEAKL